MHDNMRRSNGQALPVALLVVLVLVIYGVAALSLSTADARHAIYQEKSTNAYYDARAAADALAYAFVNTPTVAATVSKNILSSPFTGANGSTVTVMVKSVNNDPNLYIEANAVFHAVSQNVEIVMSPFDVNYFFQHGIYSVGNLDISGMDFVCGSIASAGTITTGSTLRCDGDVANDRTGQVLTLPEPIFPTLGGTPENISLNGNQVRDINSSGVYNSISSMSNTTININTGDSGDVVQIVVSNLDIKGDVNILGNGRLELYIKYSGSMATIKTPHLVNNSNPNQLFIYLEQNVVLKLDSNTTFSGYIYGPSASVKEWSGASVVGAITVGSFAANGNPDITYVEPQSGTDVSGTLNAYRVSKYK